MIARAWHGAVKAADSDAYAEFLNRKGLKDYYATPGNRGVYVFRKVSADRADFLLITLWDSFDAIRAFTGPDPEKAVYYPEDNDFLLEFEPNVTHYEVLIAPGVSR